MSVREGWFCERCFEFQTGSTHYRNDDEMLCGPCAEKEPAVTGQSSPSPEEWVPLRLVPVEVCADDYGLMDAVQAWSDCNRAYGHTYRVDDMPHREPGESVEVLVREADREFFEREWSCGTEPPNHQLVLPLDGLREQIARTLAGHDGYEDDWIVRHGAEQRYLRTADAVLALLAGFAAGQGTT